MTDEAEPDREALRLHQQNLASNAAMRPSDAERVRRALSALIDAREALSDEADAESRDAINDATVELFELLVDWADEDGDVEGPGDA